MCKGFPIVTLVTIVGVGAAALAASGPQAAPTASPRPDAKALLEQAIQVQESRTSVSARLRQTVDLFGKQMVGAGTYLEHRAGGVLRFRLESRIQLGDQFSSLRLLCDGQFLWKYEWMRDEGTLTRVDVWRVLRALEDAGRMDRMGVVKDWPGIGGLGRLLREFDANFDFGTVEASQLAGMVIENGRTADQLAVWKLTGRWNARRLAEMLPEQRQQILAGQPADSSQLPEPVPHGVDLYLGRDDLFAYRMDYFRIRPAAGKGQGSGQRQVIHTVELIHVNWNPVDPASFEYNPGNLDVKDETEEYLRSLKLEK